MTPTARARTTRRSLLAKWYARRARAHGRWLASQAVDVSARLERAA